METSLGESLGESYMQVSRVFVHKKEDRTYRDYCDRRPHPLRAPAGRRPRKPRARATPAGRRPRPPLALRCQLLPAEVRVRRQLGPAEVRVRCQLRAPDEEEERGADRGA